VKGTDVPLASRLKIPFPSTNQLIISIMIAGLGWLSGQALSQIDLDLRIMYTEYTLGAADLAHISADVMRYRNTIIRSLEADDRRDFERITESLPTQRARIQHAVDRYAAAGLRVSRSGRSEEKDIQAVRESLDQYFSAASKTIQLLTMQWSAGSPQEAEELRRKAEVHAADNAGPKVMQVSLALDRLLETVAEVSKDMRDEGTKTIRTTSFWLVGGSFFIAFLNLFLRRSPRETDGPQSLETKLERTDRPTAPLPLPAEHSNPALRAE
jgi:hypothetical protein